MAHQNLRVRSFSLLHELLGTLKHFRNVSTSVHADEEQAGEARSLGSVISETGGKTPVTGVSVLSTA